MNASKEKKEASEAEKKDGAGSIQCHFLPFSSCVFFLLLLFSIYTNLFPPVKHSFADSSLFRL